MSYSEPTPPQSLPSELAETLEDCSTNELRAVERYAEALADYREREEHLAQEDKDSVQERPEEMPADVPTRATLTIKEINDNRYYYWQWREGDKIKSQYKGPVDADDS
ncbi:hypothetical protein J2752_002825 [Halarchaeum rubridurum]|uniref:DUF6788 domain-containing protein n=1 Tax=Halarchaeum rubridurum TaxID=489911 RepID=A0A830G431_9EURY|nr:hypothetical protein [Halarchaeum rubridurum]MBP1955894.1 hypothetical protein [Halarchaeum rubridurum]GGM75228.1 hypothetical protein GCM10009017_26410 [Halarchaeum rubridurum]